MRYEEVITEIENKRRFGNLAGVEIAGRMLAALGTPQQGIPMIHIAGTNGKGSVSAFLSAILRETGIRVGMFTSPHLIDFRERIQVDGEMIKREDAARLGERLLQQDFGVHPTMFDYCLAMALLHFKEQRCDVIVLETGLGGRLDSTNAVGVPAVSVITRIGYDHMAVLGDSLEQIAAEKAGIIKTGTALVLESQEASVRSVILASAERAGVQKVREVNWADIKNPRCGNAGQVFSYGSYGELYMQMLGVHQYENAVAAILAAEAFFDADTGCAWPQKKSGAISRGIAQTRWQGRMEVLRRSPFLMVDGAHNSNGVAALRDSLTMLFPGEKFHFVMGVMAEKDYENMIEELLPLAVDFKTCTVESERALQARELAECIKKKGVAAEAVQELVACLAAENGDTERRTVAFGSLYFIGEIKALFLDK